MIKTILELRHDLEDLEASQKFYQNRLDTLWLVNSDKIWIQNKLHSLNASIQNIKILLENNNMEAQEKLELNDLRKCTNCNNNFDLEDLKKHDGDYYCEDCFNENFSYCDNCGNYEDSNNSTWFNDYCYCEACADSLLKTCDDCGEVILKENSYETCNGNLICDDCYGENYFPCYDCGEVIHVDDGIYNEREGAYFCENCYPENSIQEFSCQEMNFNNNTFDVIKSKRCFGIELELSDDDIDYNSIENETIFGSKEDCSLNTGSEFYSPILQGDSGINEVEKFYKIIENNSNDSSAGLHMHIDMREDLDNFHFIKKLLFMYNRIEKIIYSLIGFNRLHNRYCKPLNVNENKILDMQNFEDLRLFRSNDLRHDRYFGFNLEALSSHRTIELRYREGITKFSELKNWIKLNLYIFDYCKDNSLQKIIKITSNLNSLDIFITFLGIISRKDYNLIGYFISVYNKKEIEAKRQNFSFLSI